MMLEDKRFRKIDPAVMAQIDSGLTSRQYLNEGLSIMHECFMLIENLKQGNYNNYVGYRMPAATNESGEVKSGSSPPFSSVDRKKNRSSKQEIAEDEYQPSIGHDSEAITAGAADARSIADSNVSVLGLSMKARRILQIKRAEKELIKLQRRYEMVTDPQYHTDLKL